MFVDTSKPLVGDVIPNENPYTIIVTARSQGISKKVKALLYVTGEIVQPIPAPSIYNSNNMSFIEFFTCKKEFKSRLSDGCEDN